MPKKRIKHNDLTHYFMTPHEQLPASYLASCEKFFKNNKQQAIDKRQASSYNRIIKEKKAMQKKKVKFNPYTPEARLKDYQEAIQILMVDYADVWEETGTFKEVDEKLKKLGI